MTQYRGDLNRLKRELVRSHQMLEEQRERIGYQEAEIVALKELSGSLQEFIDALPGYGFAKDVNLNYVRANRAFCNLLRIPYGDILGKRDDEIFPRDLAEKYALDDRRILESGESITVEESTFDALTGKRFVVETWKHPWYDREGSLIGIYGIGFDVTEKKQAEQRRVVLEEQLRQKQRFEAIGRLAGGVAHDFNNMLTVILCCVSAVLDEIDEEYPFYSELDEIRKAALRSSDLTRQLLAFSRKKSIEPSRVDLNEKVSGILKLIQRLIGENIELIWEPAPELWAIEMDPSQVDQIVANLCINARDAIKGSGVIRLTSGNRVLDSEFCELHPGAVPGEYVRFSVADTGCGMDAETLSHIFEPFFSTKEVGKGTGLGLPIVHGAVAQSHGFIDVRSERGEGTDFAIYWPRYQGKSHEALRAAAMAPAWSGLTVLLVEDDPAVLRTIARMLKGNRCRVLSAGNVDEAITVSQANAGRIDLAITDVVMPGKFGSELGKSLGTLSPPPAVLYMSGYTADIIGEHGVLDEGTHFIEKPFVEEDLIQKMREALGAARVA